MNYRLNYHLNYRQSVKTVLQMSLCIFALVRCAVEPLPAEQTAQKTSAAESVTTVDWMEEVSSEADTAVLAPATTQPVIKESLKYSGIKFHEGSSELSRRDYEFLKEMAQTLIRNPKEWMTLSVEGNTDGKGDYRYNVQLSRKRAAVVRNALIQFGIPTARVRLGGFGPDRPIDRKSVLGEQPRDRRVDVIVLGAREAGPLKEQLNEIL